MLPGKGHGVETVQESVPESAAEVAPPAVPMPVRSRQSLPPKGSCWYCEKPLDSVRRFCGKECSGAFDEEADFTR